MEGVGFKGWGFYMQLCTPRLVAIAVSIAAIVCNTNFHVSVFIAFLFLTTDLTDFTDFFSRSFLTHPPPLGREGVGFRSLF